MKKINLRLQERSYSIVIGRNLLPSIGNLLRPLKLGKKILIVTNRRVGRLFLASMRSSLRRTGYEVVPPFILKYGNERDKAKDSLYGLWRHMAKVQLERSSTVLALGGGVVGDVTGLAASTYMRGIGLVQVPTTLLAQVDAAIGGKTAIDLPLAKNLVGTFYQPELVVADVSVLKKIGLTASGVRELRNSFAEVIKYGIMKDPQLFRLLEKKLDWFFSSAGQRVLGDKELSFLETVVWRSVRVKANIVESDERETRGERMLLNYGHTFAHAFEAASNYRLPHGKAVAMGMVCAARLARRRGIFSQRDEERQNYLIQKAGLPTRIETFHLNQKLIMTSLLLDKKKKEGRLRFVLPVAIGRVKIVGDVMPEEIKEVLGGK